MKALRVGIDLTSLSRYPTGIVRYALELSRSLLQAEAGVARDKTPDIQYVLFFSQIIHPDFLAFRGQFEAVICPIKREVWLKQLWFPLILPLQRLDVMHYPAFPPPYFQFYAPTCILTFHDLAAWNCPETLTWRGRLYFRSLLARGVRSKAWIITVSAYIQCELGQLFGDQAISHSVVIPEAAGEVFFPDSLRIPCETAGVPQQYFLMVGTIEPRKNVTRVLEAYQEIRDLYRELCPALVLVGRKGWLCRELLEHIKNLQGVLWFESVADKELVTLYERAICLVFPSLYEGFGLPVLEAMAAGCPVITSQNSAMAEIASDAAWLVDPLNRSDIQAAMQQLWLDEELRARLLHAGYCCAAGFSWVEAARKTRSLYLQVGETHTHPFE